MSASLVGSEMCIRDSLVSQAVLIALSRPAAPKLLQEERGQTLRMNPSASVSYTHLTLPTICSV
eukprot:10342436-Alexandrium_andersonii.AAC.1